MAEDRELKALQTALTALKPLDTEDQQRALEWLASKLGVAAPQTVQDGGDGGGGSGSGGGGNLSDIKEYLKERKPKDDVARATTLAYFLTNGDKKATFNFADLNQARIRAALPTLNMSRAISNAQRAGYLTTAGKSGTYQITSHGEALVEALHDPEAVKKVKAQGPRRRKTSTGTRKATKKRTAKKS